MQDEKNNRCLMIGWLAMWESRDARTRRRLGWYDEYSSCFRSKNNKVYSLPIPELKKIKKK